MMFLFGGIPRIYYSRFRERASKELAGDSFAGLPLYPVGESYAIDVAYCRELVQTLVAYVEQRPNCLDAGLGVVLLRRDWEKAPVEDQFWPFALCKTTIVSGYISKSGEGAKRVANDYATEAVKAASSLRKAVRAMTGEFQTRLRRTPLLLPVRHFGTPDVRGLLTETTVAARNADNPTEAILEACRRFEAQFPFTRTGKKKGGFSSRKGVRFESPARDGFHGKRASKKSAPHDEGCFLNSRVRLGGFFADGFHFDCSVPNAIYSGRFSNCHNKENAYVGRPHLNVYPNDFIRG
jgi:hypothetical protein